MRLTLEEVIDARWTHQIHEEWTRNAQKNHPTSTPQQWARIVELMDYHAGAALVTGFEDLIDQLSMPDPDDRHVMAAAIQCRAEGIVTFNLSDFPNAALEPHNVKAMHPDDALLGLIDTQLEGLLKALRQQRTQLKNPALSANDFLAQFARHGVPRCAERLVMHIAEI